MQMLDGNSAALRQYEMEQDKAFQDYERFEKQAWLNTIERLLGQEIPHQRLERGPNIFVLVDHMLNEPEKYGFDGNAIRFTEDLANAITAASKDWEWLIEDDSRKPEDSAHSLIWKLSWQAVKDILESPYGQEQIEDEIARLVYDAETEEG